MPRIREFDLDPDEQDELSEQRTVRRDAAGAPGDVEPSPPPGQAPSQSLPAG